MGFSDGFGTGLGKALAVSGTNLLNGLYGGAGMSGRAQMMRYAQESAMKQRAWDAQEARNRQFEQAMGLNEGTLAGVSAGDMANILQNMRQVTPMVVGGFARPFMQGAVRMPGQVQQAMPQPQQAVSMQGASQEQPGTWDRIKAGVNYALGNGDLPAQGASQAPVQAPSPEQNVRTINDVMRDTGQSFSEDSSITPPISAIGKRQGLRVNPQTGVVQDRIATSPQNFIDQMADDYQTNQKKNKAVIDAVMSNLRDYESAIKGTAPYTTDQYGNVINRINGTSAVYNPGIMQMKQQEQAMKQAESQSRINRNNASAERSRHLNKTGGKGRGKKVSPGDARMAKELWATGDSSVRNQVNTELISKYGKTYKELFGGK